MRALVFAKRNAKEILRDPMSYAFCLGVPILLLIIMRLAFYSEQTKIMFGLETLTPGIVVFSFAFVALYTAMLVSKDKATSFLLRLYTSPMKTVDFLLGYALPGFVIAIGQAIACWITATIISLATGDELNIARGLLSIVTQLPSAVMFIGIGLLFGTLFSDKAAPGITSIVITASGILGGAWTPVETLNSGFQTVCKAMPFYPGTLIGRQVYSNSIDDQFGWGWISLIAWTILIAVIAIAAFSARAKSDNK